ncbi:MAG: TetR family transcriptional regulator C-terminal domain-containing protein [Gammaproteobacteria bacterium]|nr:TetR family transcriptional regulator C-terminal domain-containing protein [Gammaproteobacteria bacterium]
MKLSLRSHSQSADAGYIRRRNESNIIESAEIEFAAHGFSGASIQMIANRAGIPKANVHYYFKSKLELYAAVLSRILDLWDTVLQDLHADDDPAEALPSYVRSKIEFSKQYPHASRVFANEILGGAQQIREYLSDGYVEWFNERIAVFAAWMAQGKIRKMPPAHLMFLLWSTTQHYADFSVQIGAALGRRNFQLLEKDYKDAVSTVTDVILLGCGLPAQSSQ